MEYLIVTSAIEFFIEKGLYLEQYELSEALVRIQSLEIGEGLREEELQSHEPAMESQNLQKYCAKYRFTGVVEEVKKRWKTLILDSLNYNEKKKKELIEVSKMRDHRVIDVSKMRLWK